MLYAIWREHDRSQLVCLVKELIGANHITPIMNNYVMCVSSEAAVKLLCSDQYNFYRNDQPQKSIENVWMSLH